MLRGRATLLGLAPGAVATHLSIEEERVEVTKLDDMVGAGSRRRLTSLEDEGEAKIRVHFKIQDSEETEYDADLKTLAEESEQEIGGRKLARFSPEKGESKVGRLDLQHGGKLEVKEGETKFEAPLRLPSRWKWQP